MTANLSVASRTSTSLPEFVYGQLRNAILNGVFAPGQMLRQDEVATKMGVSRSPLREALPRLEAEGIVVLHPRRGYAVAELHPDEINEVFELRMLLESHIAKQSIAKRTEADIARVYSIANQMREIGGATNDSDALAKWFELNASFHDALLEPAKMPHYMRSLATARGVIEAYIRAEVRLTGGLQEAQAEHAQLAQAFVNGDTESFTELTRTHSQHTRDRLLAGITKSSK